MRGAEAYSGARNTYTHSHTPTHPPTHAHPHPHTHTELEQVGSVSRILKVKNSPEILEVKAKRQRRNQKGISEPQGLKFQRAEQGDR